MFATTLMFISTMCVLASSVETLSSLHAKIEGMAKEMAESGATIEKLEIDVEIQEARIEALEKQETRIQALEADRRDRRKRGQHVGEQVRELLLGQGGPSADPSNVHTASSSASLHF